MTRKKRFWKFSPRANQSIAKCVFGIAFAILFVFNCYYFFLRRQASPADYISNMLTQPADLIIQQPFYQDMVEEYLLFNLKRPSDNHIVFAGDSITQRFNTEEFFNHDHILNRGIFSDTTVGLLNRIDVNINNIQVEKLFLLIGYNDLKHRGDEAIIRNILSIVNRSKAKTTYVQSLLPVGLNHKNLNARIDLINTILCEKASEYNYVFIDLNFHLKDSRGVMNPKFTRDGIHLNFAGNLLWYTTIKDFI
ncbi:MAG: hypothetical protein HKP58_11315 [Desulfatitalea sp.]|nr:hypothetical protein [Desulfatitalea sp.]NNK00991.1 hypothetical protein [Desulfatitalea sp.]